MDFRQTCTNPDSWQHPNQGLETPEWFLMIMLLSCSWTLSWHSRKKSQEREASNLPLRSVVEIIHLYLLWLYQPAVTNRCFIFGRVDLVSLFLPRLSWHYIPYGGPHNQNQPELREYVVAAVPVPIGSIAGLAPDSFCLPSSVFLFGAAFRCTNYDVQATIGEMLHPRRTVSGIWWRDRISSGRRARFVLGVERT